MRLQKQFRNRLIMLSIILCVPCYMYADNDTNINSEPKAKSNPSALETQTNTILLHPRGSFISAGGALQSAQVSGRFSVGGQVLGVMSSETFHTGPLTAVQQDESDNMTVPQSFALLQNYPNPFNQSTTIKFAVPNPVLAMIQMYNLRGEVVSTIVHEQLQTGMYSWRWDARNDKGVELPSGLYFCRAQAEDFTATVKLLLVR